MIIRTVLFFLFSLTFAYSQPTMLWTNNINISNDSTSVLYDATRDYSGNIITASLHPIPNNWTGVLNKYSNTGALIFERSLPVFGDLHGYQYKLTTDRIGNIYVAVDGDYQGSKQVLIKYSPGGDSLWAATYLIQGVPEDDYNASVKDVASDVDGNIYVVSTLRKYNNTASGYDQFLLVTSYSTSGALLWQDQTITAAPIYTPYPTGYEDILYGKMIINNSSSIYISISYRWNEAANLYQTKTLKYGSGGGEPQWIATVEKQPYGAPFNDMDVDDAGNIYVEFQNAGGYPISLAGIIKYNSSGSPQWEHGVAGNGNPSIAADNNGGVYIAYDYSSGFFPGNAKIYHFSQSDSSLFGEFSYPGNTYSTINRMNVDPAGFLAVSGRSSATYSSSVTEGIYLFSEFSPTGELTGTAAYSSPGESYEIPEYLFEGNGTYIGVGYSGKANYKRISWISKINVVPNPPPPPNPEPAVGWVNQTSGTNANLKSVWFKRGTEGWIVGDGGTILHTTDAGQIWSSVTSPVSDDFKEVKFFNDTLGLIVGSGSILRTSDKGATWAQVSQTGNLTLYAITSSPNNDTLVAVGSEGLGKFSTDFGLNWSNIPSATTGTLRDVEYFQNAFIAVGDLGSIYATETLNGWLQISGSLLGQDIRSSNVVDGKMYLYGTTLSTLDQNMNINQSIDFPPGVLYCVSDYPKADMIMVGGENGIIGFLERDKPAKYKTVSQSNLNDVFQSGSFVVFVGDNGTILNFNNRTRIFENDDNLFSPITMINPQTFIYVSDLGKLVRTSNGGREWTTIDSTGFWNTRFIVNGTTVWGSKDNGSQHIILLSTDNGLTWVDRSPSEPFYQFPQFATPNGKDVIVNAVGNWTDIMPVFFTNNYGVNWTVIDSIQPDWFTIYQFNDLTSLWKSIFDVNNSLFKLQKRVDISSGIWMDVFVTNNAADYDYSYSLLSSDEVFIKHGERFSDKTYHTVDGGISWDEYPSSIITPDYVDGRSFGNLEGFNFEVSDDGNFSHQTTQEYFFTNYRENFQQQYFGEDEKLKWTEDEQIVFELPMPIDTVTSTNELLYFASTPEKPINNGVVTPDTITVGFFGESGKVVSNITVLLDKVIYSSIGELTITISHLGITDTLYYQHGFNADNLFNIVFNDDYTRDLNYERPPFYGGYRPFSPLSKFAGSNPAGAWILQVYNNSVSDSGSLDAWAIKLDVENTTAVENEEALPKEFSLDYNYPNPFNPATTIRYQLPERSAVSLKIFNILGREVLTLVNEVQSAGTHSVIFDAKNNKQSYSLASGVYFYRLQAGNFVQTRKMILLK